MAAAVTVERAEQAMPFDNLAQLQHRRFAVQHEAARDVGAGEQRSLARQHNPPLACRNAGDGARRQLRTAQGVESRHAQQAGQRAKLPASYEAGHAQRRFAHAKERRDVECFEDRIDRDAVAFAQDAVERRRFAVDQDEFDFIEADAERLDHLPRRRAGRTWHAWAAVLC